MKSRRLLDFKGSRPSQDLATPRLDEVLGLELAEQRFHLGVEESLESGDPSAREYVLKQILVLGGTGFLGARLVTQLVEAGNAVTVVTRNRQSVPSIEAAGASPLLGDILDPDQLLATVGAHDAVVNVARPPFEARRYSKAKWARLQQMANTFVKTTFALGEKLDCPVILTQGTAYETTGDQVADESWPLSFVGIAEVGALSPPLFDEARKRGLPFITMLPGSIYGPGGLFREMLYEMMKKGRYRVLGSGSNCCPWIHVDDAASAYALALEKLPVGDTFILADDVACTWREFGDYLAQCMKQPHPGSVPSFAIWLVKGRRIHRTITTNCRVSNAHAKEVLGWTLKYPSYREGIPATITEIEGP